MGNSGSNYTKSLYQGGANLPPEIIGNIGIFGDAQTRARLRRSGKDAFAVAPDVLNPSLTYVNPYEGYCSIGQSSWQKFFEYLDDYDLELGRFWRDLENLAMRYAEETGMDDLNDLQYVSWSICRLKDVIKVYNWALRNIDLAFDYERQFVQLMPILREAIEFFRRACNR